MKLTGNWSLRGEYLYVDFGAVKSSMFVSSAQFGPNVGNTIETSADLNAHIARATLNYKF